VAPGCLLSSSECIGEPPSQRDRQALGLPGNDLASAARRPRGAVSPAETRDALEAFQRAAETGDLQHLLDILAPDVVFLSDGGGIVQAVLRPIVGPPRWPACWPVAWVPARAA
jgi:hypothetical protein